MNRPRSRFFRYRQLQPLNEIPAKQFLFIVADHPGRRARYPYKGTGIAGKLNFLLYSVLELMFLVFVCLDHYGRIVRKYR